MLTPEAGSSRLSVCTMAAYQLAVFPTLKYWCGGATPPDDVAPKSI